MRQAGDNTKNAKLEASSDEKVSDLVFECHLEAPPAKVWRALSIPDHLAAWLAPAATNTQASLAFDGRPAGLAGRVDCSLLAAEPPRRLRYAWRETAGDARLDSVVTFELEPAEQGGTHLRIIHGGFALAPAAANLNEPTMMLRAA